MAKATKSQAGYLGPDSGVFNCGNCSHFDGKSACELVGGTIESKGCCNLFDKGSASVGGAMKSYFEKK